MAAVTCAIPARPLSAHGTVTCSQMTNAATVMQREVDGLRVSAKRSAAQAVALARSDPRASKAKTADAKLFTLRANVEQDRVDGIRHNILHCTNDDEDSDAPSVPVSGPLPTTGVEATIRGKRS